MVPSGRYGANKLSATFATVSSGKLRTVTDGRDGFDREGDADVAGSLASPLWARAASPVAIRILVPTWVRMGTTSAPPLPATWRAVATVASGVLAVALPSLTR